MNELRRFPTPLSEDQLWQVTAQGLWDSATWFEVVLARFGWAMLALEHARGKAIYNYNLGNITATPKERHYRLTAPEFIDGEWVDRTLRYRAYKSFKESARAYWQYLGKRHPAALQKASLGDVRGAVAELKRGYYFTAPEQSYADGVAKLFAEASKKYNDAPINLLDQGNALVSIY